MDVRDENRKPVWSIKIKPKLCDGRTLRGIWTNTTTKLIGFFCCFCIGGTFNLGFCWEATRLLGRRYEGAAAATNKNEAKRHIHRIHLARQEEGDGGRRGIHTAVYPGDCSGPFGLGMETTAEAETQRIPGIVLRPPKDPSPPENLEGDAMDKVRGLFGCLPSALEVLFDVWCGWRETETERCESRKFKAKDK